MDDAEQQPDLRPGNYYVDCIRSGKTCLLAGPYPTHQQALDLVDTVRKIVNEHSASSWFDPFGTCRLKDEVSPAPIGLLHVKGLLCAP